MAWPIRRRGQSPYLETQLVGDPLGGISWGAAIEALGVPEEGRGFLGPPSNGGAVSVPKSSRAARARLLSLSLFGLLLWPGCVEQITFEKVDLKGHVRVEGPRPGLGYCFRVPPQWEIRERIEGADVVCLAPPVKGTFRESVVARTLSADQLQDPQAALKSQLEKAGEKVQVLEPWQPGRPMLVQLTDARFSSLQLGQLLFLHTRPDGEAVLICCTTEMSQMAQRRPAFEEMVAKAKFELKDCPGKGGVPTNFPTPEVTFSPSSAPTP